MTKFYLKYSPAKAGITGVEWIGPFLSEHFPDVSFKSMVSDGIIHYGIIAGTGDTISKALLALQSKFSIMKLSEKEFIGACYLYYENISIPGTQNQPDFQAFMFHNEILVDEDIILESVKSFKKILIKEIVKREFPPDNDSIADQAKFFTLFTHYYSELTPEQKTEVDALTERLKAVYNIEHCINAYKSLVENLESIVFSYYNNTKRLIDDSTSIIEIQEISYPAEPESE